MPGSVAKLLKGYELRAYWFEVFECIRKILMVGLPVFFNPGSVEQRVLGLVICFITFGMYTGLRPFIKPKDDMLAQVAQIAIFFALLAGLMIQTNADSPAIDVILMLMLIVPPTLALIFNTPLLDQVKTLYISKKSGKKTILGRGLDTAQAASVRRLDKTLGNKPPDLTGGDDDDDVKLPPSQAKAPAAVVAPSDVKVNAPQALPAPAPKAAAAPESVRPEIEREQTASRIAARMAPSGAPSGSGFFAPSPAPEASLQA